MVTFLYQDYYELVGGAIEKQNQGATAGEGFYRRGKRRRKRALGEYLRRVLAPEVGAVRIGGQGFEHAAHRQLQVANVRHFVHAGRVGCDAVLTRHGPVLAPQPTVLVNPIVLSASHWEKSERR
jgi:hypothetical protein